jgi:organic hydroperoxide reductase OsmC/OhrA
MRDNYAPRIATYADACQAGVRDASVVQAIKVHHFPVAIEHTGQHVFARAEGKQAIELAGAGSEESWSSEELLAAAVGSSFARTVAGVAERFELPLHELAVDAVGQLGARPGGGVGLTSFELRVRLRTDAGHQALARSVCERSAYSCPISSGLTVPVGIELTIQEEVVR